MENQYEIDGFENVPFNNPQPQSEPASTPVFASQKQESPFADSPYVMADQPCTEPAAQAQQEPAVQPEPKKKKKKSQMGKAVAIVLAASLIAGCFIGSFLAISQLSAENAQQMQVIQQLYGKIDDLKEEMQKNSYTGNGNSVSGTPNTSPAGLTPGQVYAQNVDSVVAITSYLANNGMSTGSGFITSEDGYILTNCHVIEGASRITVTTHDGQTYQASLVGSDSTNDVALLKIMATGLQAAKLGSSDDLIVGDQVVAVGNPLGELTATLTVGYISAKDRNVTTDGTVINMLQTDAAINSGNSGGPLFNMKGEVIGITTAKYSGATASGATIEGIGFAIPVDDVKEIAKELLEKGYVSSAYLGVYVRDSNDGIGVYVESAEPGGSAALAGVRSGDYIIALGEYDITSLADLTRALRKLEAGDTTTITVFRGRKVLELTITLQEKPVESANGNIQIPESTEPVQPGDAFDDWWNNFFGD